MQNLKDYCPESLRTSGFTVNRYLLHYFSRGLMNRKKLGKLYPVKVVDFDVNWSEYFKVERNRLKSILGENIRIEHIGSTAIHGIKAKPTIDLLVQKPENIPEKDIISLFTKSGYIHMTDQKKHLMFVKGYTPDGLEKISYHIHMGPLDQDWLWDRVFFRDYINANIQERKQYESLKLELSKKFQFDREAYTDGKEGYIKEITQKAKLEMQ